MNYILYKSIEKDTEGYNTVLLIPSQESKAPESFLQVFKKVAEFKTIRSSENFIGGKFIRGCGLKMTRIKYKSNCRSIGHPDKWNTVEQLGWLIDFEDKAE